MVLSDRALRRLARINDARHEHAQAHGGEPTSQQLVTATGLARHQIEDLLVAELRPRGLEETSGNEDGSGATVGELLVDPKAEAAYVGVTDRMDRAALHELTAELDQRERSIVLAHYGLGRRSETLRQIAESLHLSVERVRQIEVEALDKVRESATATETLAPDGS